MDFLRTLFEGTLAHIVVLVGAPLVAAWIARMRIKGSSWAVPIMYGLGSYALIMIGLVSLQVWLSPPSMIERITPDNAESHIHDWLDTLGVSVQRQTDPATYFQLMIALQDGDHVLIKRGKDRDRYISFMGRVDLSPEHAQIVAKLTPAQAIHMFDEVMLEMARSGIGFAIIHPSAIGQVQAVVVTRSVPLTEGLNADTIVSAIDKIDSGMLLAREAIRLALINTHAPGTETMLLQ
jgi:hypothetical protein